MRGIGLHMIAPVILAVIGTTGVLSFDYVGQRSAAPASLSVVGYLGQIPQRLVAQLKDMQPAPETTIASFVPDVPEGWTRRDIESGDQHRLTGLTVSDAADDALARAPMLRLYTGAQTRGFSRAGGVYDSPTGTTILSITFLPAQVFAGLGGVQQEVMQDMLALDSNATDFADVGGVVFDIETLHDAPHVREVDAAIGRQVQIGLLSDDTDAAILSLLDALDMVGLNALLAKPVDRVKDTPAVLLIDADTQHGAEHGAEHGGNAPSGIPPQSPLLRSLTGLFGGGALQSGEADLLAVAETSDDTAAFDVESVPAPQVEPRVVPTVSRGTGVGGSCSRQGAAKTCMPPHGN